MGRQPLLPRVEAKDTPDNDELPGHGPVVSQPDQPQGPSLGPLSGPSDTTRQYRRDVLLPFFNQYLKPAHPKADTPPVLIYNTGETTGTATKTWPQSCEKGCPVASKPLYLEAGGELSFEAPAAAQERSSTSTSPIPAKPVPYQAAADRARTTTRGAPGWSPTSASSTAVPTCSLRDRAADRADEALRRADRASCRLDQRHRHRLGGEAHRRLSRQRQVPPEAMGGYELPIATDIFRGRYRTSFEHPQAIEPNSRCSTIRAADGEPHLQPGHRIMVQVQSTLFPLLRPQPADVRAQHLHCEAIRLSESHAAHLAHAG